MNSRSFLLMGALLAVGSLLAVPGCGDDTTTGAGGSGAGTTTSSSTSGSSTSTSGSSSSTSTSVSSSGSGMVAPSCATYCTDITANCSGMNGQYTDMANCLKVCAEFDVGESGAVDGNTLGCREYHAGMPAMGMPEVHCIHAGPLGGGVCGADACEAFCQIGTALCTTADTGWADEAACLAECNAFPVMPAYNSTITDGDSLACRMYHLQVASNTPAPHCLHVNEASPPCQ